MKTAPASVLLVTILATCAHPTAGETPPAEPSEPTILGQPAGWTLEEPAETLVGVQEGAELRAGPESTAEVLARLPAARLDLLDWRERWVKVRYRDLEGWVDLDATPVIDAPTAEPAEVLRQALEADPWQLLRALDHLGSGRSTAELAAWTLHTDLDKPAFLAELEELASQLEEVYQERYGLSPVAAEKRGAVILHAEKASYDRFNEQAEDWVDRHAAGQAMPGMVVLYAGERPRDEIAATMLHELTHLLNWQTFHRQLPVWLEEGLAEDLSLVSVDAAGRIVVSPLSKGNLRLGKNIVAMLEDLCAAREEQSLVALSDLLAMDQAAFAARAQQHYAVTAFWVRFLLRGGDDVLAERFRSFLLAVALGEEASFETLQQYLERDLATLEEAFHDWLDRQREQLTKRRKRRGR